MKLKRIVALLLAMVMAMSCMSLTVAATDVEDFVIRVEKEYATIGSTVTLNVLVENNPGILGMTLRVEYDETAAKLIAVENGDCLPDLHFTTPGKFFSGCQLPWDGERVSKENIFDGVIAKLTFEVSETAEAEKDIDIKLSYNPGAIINDDLKPLAPQIENGAIHVIDYIPGDVNTDGFVDTTDAVFLRRYIAKYDISINLNAADVNADGYINTTDVVYIRRYVAGGYNVVLKPAKHIHTEVIDQAKAPTCTESGLTAGKHCETCNEVLTAQETIPALGHNYVDGVCSVCGDGLEEGIADGTLVFEENFDYADDNNTASVLETIGWTKLTKELNGVYNETDAEFAIIDGRLYYDNWDAEPLPEDDLRIRGMDGYYQIDMLNQEYMRPYMSDKYTLQYDLEYVDSKNISRFANIITHCSEDGQCYISFHFRIGGYGNHQCHFYGSWKTFDAFDPATDLYVASTATDAESATTKGTPIAYKLIGEYYDANDPQKFANIPVTVKLQWEPEMGYHVYMKTADMVDFVKVSEPSIHADGPMYLGWEGYAVQFKLGATIDGYIDNIAIWTGWGEKPEAHTVTEWIVTKEPTCTSAGSKYGVCTDCGETVTKVISKLPHSYSEWTQITAPSCTAIGVETRCCACDHTETRELAKLFHVFEDDTCITCGRGYNYELNFSLDAKTNTYIVSGIGNCTDTEIYIPATYSGLPVTQIATEAFYGCANLVSIVIPDSVTTIGADAFRNCTSLSTLILSDNLTSIDTYAFTKMPQSAYTIDALGGMYLGTATNPYFMLVDMLSTQITEYVVNVNTKYIYSDAFYNCKSLTSVTIPEGVFAIGAFAFMKCTALESIVIPKGVVSIGYWMFDGCTSLKSVSIPASATDIKHGLFSECPSIESVSVHADNPRYMSVGNSIIDKKNQTLVSGTAISVIPADGSVTKIGSYAFAEVPIATVTIPESVVSIGTCAFRGCQNLTTILVAEGNTVYRVEDNCLIAITDDTLVATSANINVIPASVKKIGAYAFLSSQITEITIPDSVTAIGNYAFDGCKQLTSIKLPASLKTIGTYVFRNCSNLTTVTIPSSVIKIGNYAFDGCTSLRTVYYTGTNEEWGAVTIGSNNTPLQNAKIIFNAVDIPEEGVLIFEETFDYDNNSDTASVLNTIGWTKLTKELNGVYNETDAEFAIVDGRLYFDNWDAEGLPEGDTRIRGKDGYYQINVLNQEYMEPIVMGKYTLQYDLEYTDAKERARYAVIITECSPDGQCYNQAALRIGGYGFHSCHFYGKWKTFCAFDPATDLYGNSQAISAEDALTKGTPIVYKLLGKYYDSTSLAFLNIPITIKLQWDPEMGHHVYMKTAEMDEFVKVSEPSINADGPMYLGWEGYAVQFKLGATIDGYIDNIAIWTGWGEKPESHTVEEWTVTVEPTCQKTGEQQGICTTCGETVTKEISTLKHIYSSWTETKAPTCTEVGQEMAACDHGCGRTKTRSIAKISHNFVNEVCTACGCDQYSEGLEYSLSKDATYYTVTGIGTCTDTELRIPAAYEGIPVTHIGWGAFSGNTSITSVVLMDGITTIEAYAFDNCTMLTEFILPDTLISIGEQAIPQTVKGTTLYENGLYLGTKSNPYMILTDMVDHAVTSFTIHEDTRFIGDYALQDADQLTSLVIPDGVLGIGRAAFGYCASLMSITLPETLTAIRPYAFGHCTALTTIDLPNSLKQIEYYAFSECTSLVALYIPASVVDIGFAMIYGCNSLTALTVDKANAIYHSENQCIILTKYKSLVVGCSASVIPDDGSVETIGSESFAGVKNLKSIEIPRTVTFIEFGAFSDSSLEAITIPASVTNISVGAFNGCNNLTYLTVDPDNETYYSVGNCVINKESKELVAVAAKFELPTDGSIESLAAHVFDNNMLAEIDLPSGITTISQRAFQSCYLLESITIPASVTSIGDGAFWNCNNITDVYYGGTEEQWNAIAIEANNGYLTQATIHFNSQRPQESLEYTELEDGTLAVVGLGTVTSNEIEIPAEVNGKAVTQIASRAFQSKSKIAYVKIPNSVVSIGDGAFFSCKGLKYVDIPASVTFIGNTAFGRTANLSRINVEEGNTAYKSVNGCLIDIANKTLIGVTVTAVIPTDGSVEIIGSQVFSGKSGLDVFAIPEGITTIMDCAFIFCSGLNEVHLPSTVTSIDSMAFRGCYNLSTFTVASGNQVYHVAGNALIETATQTLVRGGKNTVIPTDGSVLYLGSDSFSYVEELVEIVIPHGVKAIEKNAFSDCKDLTTVTLPASIEYLASSSLGSTKAKIYPEVIYYQGTEEQWNKIEIATNNDYLVNVNIIFNELKQSVE